MTFSMEYNLDFNTASANQIETGIGERIHRLRLARNWTREKLAQESGVSMRTIANLEEGRGVTFNTLIRVLKAMNLQANLAVLFPDPDIRPMELLETGGKPRRRASSQRQKPQAPTDVWTWKE